MLVGEIKLYGGATAPDGWGFCDGTLLPIASFSSLFSVLGNRYGGDGINTFALPDLRGKVPIGAAKDVAGVSDYELGDEVGAESVTLTTDQMPDHNHPVNAVITAGDSNLPTGNLPANTGDFDSEYSTASKNTIMSNDMIESVGGGQAHENRQPSLCVNYIIGLFGCKK